MAQVHVQSVRNVQQRITVREHVLRGDEPVDAGGNDTGPNPYEYLLAALGSCMAMTLLLYARRKRIPLEGVAVVLEDSRIHAQDCADCESTQGFVTDIHCGIELKGQLSEEQRARLLEIAGRCPVHRALTGEIKIRERLV